MPNQFSEISGNREMEVSGRPNRTSSGQLMSAGNQKTPNNSDLDNSDLKVYFFLVKRSCKQ